MEVGLRRARPVRTHRPVLAGLRLILGRQAPFWYLAFLVSSVIAVSLDPLFLYIPVINDDKKCIGIDKKLGNVAIALRSMTDFFHLFYIFFHLPAYWYLRLLRFFLIDLLSILPLPQDALQSGIVEVTDFPVKFLHSFLWGLQNLSCFGQNLQTSSYVWENVFTISITLSGLVLFLYLVGNMQIYMQSKRVRSEEKRLKRREIEEWSGFKRLSEKLQEDIRKYQQLLCRETRGSDVDSSLDSLPKSLRRTAKSTLALKLLMNVPIFEKMDRQVLKEVCNLLKFRMYNEGIEIVQKGDPFEDMHFVMRGELMSMAAEGGGTSLFNADILQDGDFFGLDLILWSLDPHSSTNNLPISARTIRTFTEVEAFYLTTDDMKLVASKLCKQFKRTQIQRALRYYSEQ
ncbi:cyclic nucleotide-gated ion channel 1-like [Mangifera indica]|uniref:cyclic nucleotide-gated ion channel 1-like n=1 Tax=Mangifera indica TaxID=29780 RepID=UPI001CFBB485|nr:cyclic nucleotide-gated ion channel 1-like [Mangifera indica]